LIFALLADGVPADRLYPLDIDRAFKKLDRIKPHIKVWWREGNQSQQLIRDGELDMMSIWNGRASELKEAGVAVELIWNGAVRIAPRARASRARPTASWRGNSYSSPRNPSPRPSSTGGSITARPIRRRSNSSRTTSRLCFRPTARISPFRSGRTTNGRQT